MADLDSSWADIAHDDRLLDVISRGEPLDPSAPADPATGPLQALARVGAEALPPALDADRLLAAAEDRRGRRYAVRSLAVAVTVVASLSASGVAAVVTGDPFHPAKAVWQHLRGDSRVVAPDDGEILGSSYEPGLRARAPHGPRSSRGDGGGRSGDGRPDDARPALLGQAGSTPPAERPRAEHTPAEPAQADTGRSGRIRRTPAGTGESRDSGEAEQRAVPGTDPGTRPGDGSDDSSPGTQETADEAGNDPAQDPTGSGAEVGDEAVGEAGDDTGDRTAGEAGDGTGGEADDEAGDEAGESDPVAEDPGTGVAEGLYPSPGDQAAAPPTAPSALVSPAPR